MEHSYFRRTKKEARKFYPTGSLCGMKILPYWLFVRGIRRFLAASPNKSPETQKAFARRAVFMHSFLAVDGHWMDWSPWSSCTTSCDYGTQRRTRTCSEPISGGHPCEGVQVESGDCNNPACPGGGLIVSNRTYCHMPELKCWEPIK